LERPLRAPLRTHGYGKPQTADEVARKALTFLASRVLGKELMSTDRLLSNLKQSKLFRELGTAGLVSLEHAGAAIELEAGEIIIEEGQQVTDLFVVIRGELEVYLPKTESRVTRIRVARRVPGDCIGEYSFVDKNPASASVAAKVPSEVFRISQVEFERKLDGDPALGRIVYRNLLHLLVARLREEIQVLDLFRPLVPGKRAPRSES
jgi:signal-transduction protein with cAMP-binding, CBS, and nucleotidyltransferase domain